MLCTFAVTLCFHSTEFLKANIEISTIYLITLGLWYFADIRLYQSECIFKIYCFLSEKKEKKRKKKQVKAEYRIWFVLLMYKQAHKYLCNLLLKVILF